MGNETKQRSDWLNRTNVMIGIGASLVTLIATVGTLLADDGPSEIERYRSALAGRLCGGLKAAVHTSQPEAYARDHGRIDKAAWLAAMDTTAGHLTEGREALQTLPPPADLHGDWQATNQAWGEFIGFWSDYRRATATLSDGDLTVFDYPPPQWAQRLSAANSSFGTSIEKLLKTSCATNAHLSDAADKS